MYFKNFPKDAIIRFLPDAYIGYNVGDITLSDNTTSKCIFCEMEANKKSNNHEQMMKDIIFEQAVLSNLAYKVDNDTMTSNYEEDADISTELVNFAELIIKHCLTILASKGNFEGGAVSAFDSIAQ